MDLYTLLPWCYAQNLSPAAKLLLGVLAWRQEGLTVKKVTFLDLQKWTGYTERHTYRALSELVEQGVITRLPKEKHGEVRVNINWCEQ